MLTNGIFDPLPSWHFTIIYINAIINTPVCSILYARHNCHPIYQTQAINLEMQTHYFIWTWICLGNFADISSSSLKSWEMVSLCNMFKSMNEPYQTDVGLVAFHNRMLFTYLVKCNYLMSYTSLVLMCLINLL